MRLSHGYKGVTVRLHFGPFVRRRNPGQAESTSGWCIPERSCEEGRGFRHNRAIAGDGGITVSGTINLFSVDTVGKEAEVKSRLNIHVAEHSSDVQNIGLCFQHRLRTGALCEGLRYT